MELADLHRIAEEERAARKPVRILCCTSTGCRASGSLAVKAALEKAVNDHGLYEEVQVVGVGCPGLCSHGPLVELGPGRGCYERVVPDQAAALVASCNGGPAPANRIDSTHPFFAGQRKIVRATAGLIDPERVEEYIAEGGYKALELALQLTPSEIVQTVTRCGLRGRGGAGYPTGLKWATVAKMPSGQKYVVCNGDEGDPGAFMDRAVMEDAPHQVIEGMAIAGHAVGANQGYIYVRAEYPLAVERLRKAITQAMKLGLLGMGILGTRFDFKVDVRIGAGAFVCGEETALISSLEGNRGIPRPRPPYPAESGLWGCPTLINNVETLATIPTIIWKGADWYAAIGTEKSKGTKIFSLTGKVVNAGLVEVPLGTTLRQVVEEMGGGVPGGGRVKAIQTGGPSGGCIPAEFLDTPIEYDTLAKLGSIMGSGGMIVMDETDNMPEVARFFMEFCADESCGKCIPCRVGTVQLHHLLTRIIEKKATKSDLTRMIQLCYMVRDTSLCGLGQSAPNPVLTTLRYFMAEYEALLMPEEFPGRNGHAKSIPLTVIP
jgi:bidirectional [NiFe] hydrogenase diaphorase subunit